MLLEWLASPDTYKQQILPRMVRVRTGIPDSLTRIFSDSEVWRLRFEKKGRLPKYVKVGGTEIEHTIIPRQATINAIHWLCRQVRTGEYEFSRLRGGAFAKKQDKQPSVLPLGDYYGYDAADKNEYRVTLRPTFPDLLLLQALAVVVRNAFPPEQFLPGVCGYLPLNRNHVSLITSHLQSLPTVLRFDVSSFNETVDQQNLLELVLSRVADLPDCSVADRDLIKRLLQSYFKRVSEALQTPGIGIGMGSPLTPLFTNI